MLQDVYVEDGRARYRGTELSLTGEITPQLSMYASGLILDAKQVSGAPTVINGTKVSAHGGRQGRLTTRRSRPGRLATEYRFAGNCPD